MRLVGLISGGKDSLFNLLQCIAAGHEIVAVANVEPYNKEELESYMYQSVGHEIIALVAEALELPIYRQKTRGQAVCKSKTYRETAHDEVEDLFILLNKVKKEMHIEGVSVGAITSDYQRTRVENICSRLGLLCFAYLWKRDQEELLQEMIDAELDAIVIKVATIGLNPEVHLGMHIKDIKSHLIDLNKKFGVHICGEGGEYETMTVDCPLFHRMINISETQNIILSNDAFAPSAYLTVKKALLQPKKWGSDDPKETLKTRLSHIQAIVKNPYNYIQDCVDDISTEIVPHSHTLSSLEGLRFNFSRIRSKGNLANNQEYWKKSSKVIQQPHSSQQGTKITQVSAIDTTICKLNSSTGWCCLGNVSGLTLLDAFYCMQKHLDKAKYNMEDVVFLSLYIRDISEYQNLNKTYSQFIPSTLPPARACVSTRLPPEIGVLIIAIAHRHFSKGKKAQKETSDRVTMHVQSISHWAPANIGPYSQCVKIGGLYYLAGQIPLVPGTMEILNKPIFHQCKLALRHALRVMQAMNDGLQYSNVLQAICYVTSTEVAADIPFLWSFISKNECATLASVVVSALPKNAELEWEILACDFKDPQVKEEEAHVEDYYIQMKRCVYKDPFASSLVCKISHPKKLRNSSQKTLKIVTSNGISTVLGHCLDFLRGDLKTLGSYLCILKLFYKSSDSVMGRVLKDITKTFGHKVVATVIPVVACPDDVFLTVAGVCH